MTLEEQVTQAAARGYCHPENASKEVDAALLKAIVEEIVKAISPDPASSKPKRPPVCAECGTNRADPPSRLCPGCWAYRDHTR